MRRILTLVVVLMASLSGFAQQGTMEGKVTDAATGQSITGVTITVSGENIQASTNLEGVLLSDCLPARNIRSSFSSVGYASKELSDIELAPGQLTHLDIINLQGKAKTESG